MHYKNSPLPLALSKQKATAQFELFTDENENDYGQLARFIMHICTDRSQTAPFPVKVICAPIKTSENQPSSEDKNMGSAGKSTYWIHVLLVMFSVRIDKTSNDATRATKPDDGFTANEESKNGR